jgi:preprotein translocase subunit SecD
VAGLLPDTSRRIWVTPPIREQIHCLTREIVDQTVAIFVAGQCIMSPMIREPLCGAGWSFQLSANDLAEAQTLAERLRTGWRAAGPRLVP